MFDNIVYMKKWREWVIHNGILAISTTHREKIKSQALTRILELVEKEKREKK